MKIRSFFAGLVMAAAVFTGCEPKEELGMPDVTFGATELEFTQEAGSKDMKFTATREWKAVYDADWIAVTPETGKGSNAEQTVTVTVTENTKGNRSAKVTITIGMVEKAFTVNQAGPDGDTGGVEALTVKEFIERADTENYYRLTGTVSGFNASYCSFDITDETGKIYVYSVTEESKAEWSGKIKNGGTVVLQGKYEFYEAKSQHEVVDAIIESFTAGEEEDLSKVQTISCAEFIEKADPNTTYRLVGEVVSSVNTTYCSFDMNDGTGKVVVWTVNNKDEWKDVVKKGGTVTVRGKYMLYTTADGTVKHEMVDAYIEKFEDGSSSGNTGDQTEEKWYVYKKAAAVESGKAYLIVAEGKAGISYEASSNYGYLKTVGVTDNNGEIVASGNNAFIFTSVEGGYTVSQAVDGRYLTMEGDYNSFNLSAEAPGANGVFTVEEGSEGRFVITNTAMNKSLQYDVQYGSYGCYPDERGVYPYLYERTVETEAPDDGGNDDGGNVEIDPNAFTIVLDASSKLCDEFPEGSTGVTETKTYTIGDHEWTFSPSSGNKFSWYKDGYVLWGKKGGYILMPAVEGKKLTQVVILTGKNASVKVQVGVYDAEGSAAVAGGEAKTLSEKNAEFSYTLTDTEVNTQYQFRVVSEHNAQFQKLTLVYE